MSTITKPTLPVGLSLDFADLMDGMDGGRVYIGDGKYATESAAETAFADQTAAATALATFEELGEFQETPFSGASDVEMQKTYHHSKQGKRTTTFELNIAGLSAKQKNWMEQDLPKKLRTVAIQSDDLGKVLVINGCTWAMTWNAEADNYYTITIKTEFGGPTQNRVIPIPCPVA